MYHPGKYNEHNQALLRLIHKFNEVSIQKGNEVKMYYQKNENYRDDGGIIYNKTFAKILYDFEKRHNYYDCCNKLKFDTLGQFERKIAKAEIKLSIQCSSDEKCFIIAWHDDYQKEKKEYLKSQTADGKGERNAKRFTKDFVEIAYSEMDKFYDILVNAFKYNSFNKKSFSLLKENNLENIQEAPRQEETQPICTLCQTPFIPRKPNATLCINCWKKERGYLL